MSDTTIDLPEWFRRQEEFQHRVTEAEKQAVAARSRLYEASEDIKRIVLKQLDQGQSTGNVVQDEAFRIFGLNKEALERCTLFSQKLIGSKGKEMLITFPYRQQICFSGPGDERESDYQNRRGYILGILSGERLKFSKSNDGIENNWEVTLPFERHIRWGFTGIDGEIPQPKVGEATLCGRAIINLGKPTASSFISWVTDKMTADISIFVGNEIDDQLHQTPLVELTGIRRVLNSATPEERFVGESI